MPLGTGVAQSTNLPSEPFAANPDDFFAMTTRNEAPVETKAAPTAEFQGMAWEKQLPQTGIISRLLITIVAEVVVSTAPATTSARWPYGMLDSFALSTNGQNNLWSCDGIDLHALRFARNPSYEDTVDVFPGTVGGGDSLAVGTHEVYLTFEVPIAMDDTSLVGALYAQSGSTNLSISRRLATAAPLFSANPGNVAISGTVHTALTRFSVPRAAAGEDGVARLVVPDLSRLHAFNAVQLPITATGDVRLEMIRSAGSLARLFFSGESTANTPLLATADAAAANKIDAIRLEYGAAQRPYAYDPASVLLARNNDYYGATLPYDRLALDFVRENAPRDVVNLLGLTDLALIPTINSSVVLNGGKARMVQETLF